MSVELSDERTVHHMSISESCIARKNDLQNWPHLYNIELQQLGTAGVMLVVSLKQNLNLFLLLEYQAGGEEELVACSSFIIRRQQYLGSYRENHP